ncbi:hypothetical protein MtrunA17_Chr7g0231261 [Medicago truncatula]|uniref:Uncharacterized protein n=1 Tax=Medicago truncatula TaxID=3880 RepID=A0A396GY88_MEDTR|nr:hypothetical protein MtrunA17_Chr7g0231261 [Medicago truncatula]
MPNTNLSTQLVQDQPALQEFIPSHPEALGRNGEENGKADLSFLREEIQNLGFLCFFSQPKTLQVQVFKLMFYLKHRVDYMILYLFLH